MTYKGKFIYLSFRWLWAIPALVSYYLQFRYCWWKSLWNHQQNSKRTR